MARERGRLPARTLNAKLAGPALRRLLWAVIGGAFFVALSIFLLRVDAEPGPRLAAWAGIVFFGGGGILAALAAAAQLRSRPALRLGDDGVTWLQTSPLQRFTVSQRLGAAGTITAPWASIRHFMIVTVPTPMAPRGKRKGAESTVVGVVPRDFNEFAGSAAGPLQRSLRGFVLGKVGAMPTPPYLEIPSDELFALLQRYQAQARAETIAPHVSSQ